MPNYPSRLPAYEGRAAREESDAATVSRGTAAESSFAGHLATEKGMPPALISAGRQDARSSKPQPIKARAQPYLTSSSIRANVAGPSAHNKVSPSMDEHKALLSRLTKDVNRNYRSHINRFLVYLEQSGLSWSNLLSADPGEATRPLALEQAVQRAIAEGGLHTSTRAAINSALGFVLPAPSSRVILEPTRPEHITIMANLPEGTDSRQRSYLNRFLWYLEQKELSWSYLMSVEDSSSPQKLEEVVNQGISDKALASSTRAAINQIFDLSLKAESGRVRQNPTLPEHISILRGLVDVSSNDRSRVNLFLCYLEQKELSWSALVPPETSHNILQPALTHVLNEGVRAGNLSSNVRSTLSRNYHYVLPNSAGKVHLAPVQEEHANLVDSIPRHCGKNDRSCVNRFLCYLEISNVSWSQLVSAHRVPDGRPPDLENMVNHGIAVAGLQTSTRAAINRAFGLSLVPPSQDIGRNAQRD